MDNDYRRYEELRANGASADEAYRAAVREGPRLDLLHSNASEHLRS